MFYKDDKLFTESEIRALNPNTSFPTTFMAEGYEVVFDTPSPTVGELEVAYQDGTEIDAKGNRVIKWSVKDMFADVPHEDGTVTTKAQLEAEYLLAKRKALVPKVLTPRQARLALLAIDLLDDADILVTNDRALAVWWEYSLDIQRDHEMVTALAVQLDLDDEELDNLFIEGSKL